MQELAGVNPQRVNGDEKARPKKKMGASLEEGQYQRSKGLNEVLVSI